jgi:hypothetical protein
MQHLNNGFSKFDVYEFNSCKDVDSSKNVKKLITPFKFNSKTLSSMCFNIFQYYCLVVSI